MSASLKDIIDIARKAHLGQTRFDKVTPYFTHLEGVARSFDPNEETLIKISYLHDILENTPMTAQALLDLGIMPLVVQEVVALTKVEGEDYFVYLARVKQDGWSRRVKIADILYNLSDSPTKKQIKKYAKALKFLLDPL